MGWRTMFWSQQQSAGTGATIGRAKTLGTKRFEDRGGRKCKSQSLHPQEPSGNWGAAPDRDDDGTNQGSLHFGLGMADGRREEAPDAI